MVQKQAAYNRDAAGNAFADDDPLAELARLVGYDAPVLNRDGARRVEPQVSAAPAVEPAAYAAHPQPVDLQNELLRDLDGYVDDRQPHRGYEPVSFGGGAESGRTALDVNREDDIGREPDLADELLWSMSEVAVEPQHSRSGGADPTEGYGRYRLPLANFNPVHSAPPHPHDPPMQRQEPVLQPQEPAPVSYAAPAPVERYWQPEPGVDFAAEPQAAEAPFAVEPERRAAPATFQEPVFEAPIFEAPVFETPVVETPAFEARTAPRRDAPNFFEDLPDDNRAQVAAPQLMPEPPLAAAVEDATEDDFFAGDLELDLAEIELDLSEFEPEPVVVREPPNPVAVEPPSPVAVEPLMQHEERPVLQPSAARQTVVNPAYEPARQQQRTPVQQAAMESPVPPLPFDAAAISDQDEQLEVIAHLDVPDLPPVEDQKPVNYATDYDFDIDSELANLLDKTAEQHPMPQPAAARAPAAPVVTAAVPPIAEQVRNMPSDDFDVFEKALEEDFRRSLDTQYSFAGRQAPPPPEELEADDDEYEVPSSSRRWIAVAAAAAIVLVAGGGVYAWMHSSGGEMLGGGEPKIVMADTDPVKVVPANPGGKSVPNQNKAVYDRVSGATPEQPAQKNLISSEEEPMDVAQRTLEPDSLPLDDEASADNANANADAQPANSATTGDNQSLAPRRVKTMIVRPDGSLVAQDEPAAAGTQTANAAAPAPALSAPSSAPASSGQSVDDVLASGGAASATPAAEAVDTAGVPAPNMPVPLARPTQTASAASAPARLAPPAAQPSTPAAPATASTATASGDYLIQISSLPTEADAQKSYKNLSTKYASVIGGRGMNIKAAEVAGKGTYYRVRIPAGSKDAAVSLCERYRAVGGSCMVVR
ncbi:hypothetical protein H4S14_001413 [Agrobacterium vitis]|nr:hypothetical protein [Agrobacterium vitis]MBE1437675.1 hypothetical protein [Agrobacterium vitis]